MVKKSEAAEQTVSGEQALTYMESLDVHLKENPEELRRWQGFCSWATPVHQWATVFLPHWFVIPFTPFHSDMMQAVVDGILGNIPSGKIRTAIISPRGFAKSTCARAATLYVMLECVANGTYVPRHGMDYDFYYTTSTLPRAKQAYRPIINELKFNKFLHAQYGKQLKWLEKGPPIEWELYNGISGGALSIGGQLRGGHPAAQLLDDVETKDNIGSDETRAKFQKDWESDIDQMMIPGKTYSVLIGNYMHLFCLYRHVALMNSTHTIIRSALEPVDGRMLNWYKWMVEEGMWDADKIPKLGDIRSIWPQMYSTEILRKEEGEKPITFSTEKMNNPIVSTDSPVKLENIRYYSPEEKRKNGKWWGKFKITCMTDPAARLHKRNGDTAIVAIGWDQYLPRPDAYVFDVRIGKFSDEETINQNFAIYTMYEPDHQGIEAEGFQNMYITMSKMAQNRPMSFNLRPHQCQTHGRGKIHRLQKASYYLNHGRVFFDRNSASQRQLIDQLVSYQEGDKFDAGDAFCMALNQLVTLFPPQVGGDARPRGLIRTPRYDPRTGRFLGYR